MSYILIVTIAIVIFSLIFDFINGSMIQLTLSQLVSTRALTPNCYFISSSNELLLVL